MLKRDQYSNKLQNITIECVCFQFLVQQIRLDLAIQGQRAKWLSRDQRGHALDRIEGIVLDKVLAPRTSTIASQTAQLTSSQKNWKWALWCCWQWGSWCGIWVEDQCQWVWAWDGHFSEHKGEILWREGRRWVLAAVVCIEEFERVISVD